MLEGLEPSIALTGGPWYTDNELDTEFIQNLTEACYKIISATVRCPLDAGYAVFTSFSVELSPKQKHVEW